ncbi:MAG: hypothetical protein WC565_01025 [Parcubacteria group bacterium]
MNTSVVGVSVGTGISVGLIVGETVGNGVDASVINEVAVGAEADSVGEAVGIATGGSLVGKFFQIKIAPTIAAAIKHAIAIHPETVIFLWRFWMDSILAAPFLIYLVRILCFSYSTI